MYEETITTDVVIPDTVKIIDDDSFMRKKLNQLR